MAQTTKLGMTLLEANQSGAETTVNAALNRLDQLSNIFIVDKGLTTAPGSPDTGAAYIVAGTGGAWSTFAVNDIAWWDGSVWANARPTATHEGMTLYVQDENKMYYWTGSAWAILFDPTTAGIESQSGHITAVLVKEYTLEEEAPYAYTINSLSLDLGTGTDATVAIKIRDPNDSGGTAVVWPGSATTITATTAHSTTDAASANVVAALKQVVLVISAVTATPADLTFTMKTTRS